MAIDDTDNKESAGTGRLLENLREAFASRGIGTQPISRHQLYFHSDVPYTSHNSSMCTEMDVDKTILPELIEAASVYLVESCAEGSDPGLCVACIDDVPAMASLIAYGRRCKNSLVTKEEAYQLAKEQSVHLSEHGGSGQGVVGALAAVGLRLYGFDGRLRGKTEIGSDSDILTADDMLDRTGFDSVMAVNGAAIRGDERIVLTEGRVKAVRMNWRSTILVAPSDERAAYATLGKKQLKEY